MSEPKFSPRVAELVPASAPHPPDTSYRVGIGPEDWGGGYRAEVEKVQMVYAGKIAGRKAPSFPAGSDDAERVRLALERVRKLAQKDGPDVDADRRAWRALSLADLIGSARGLYGTPEDVQAARDELRREWP